jgi:N-acetylneuraminic acid mutarotase
MLWYDISARKWSQPTKLPFKARANHVAILVSGRIWVIGGGNSEEVMGDVHTLDLQTLKWHIPSIR